MRTIQKKLIEDANIAGISTDNIFMFKRSNINQDTPTNKENIHFNGLRTQHRDAMTNKLETSHRDNHWNLIEDTSRNQDVNNDLHSEVDISFSKKGLNGAGYAGKCETLEPNVLSAKR